MTFILSVLLLSVLLFCWMFFVEPYRYEISRHNIMLNKRMPRSLKILHLSDIHFSGRNAKLSAFFDRLAAEPCDLAVITGDIIDCIEGIPEAVQNLSKLKPAYGIYAVLGNHDYLDYKPVEMIIHNIYEIIEKEYPERFKPSNRQRADLLIDALEKIGVRVLRNESLEKEMAGTPFLIHGLDDATTGQANLMNLQKFDKSRINLLLTHTVDVFLDIGHRQVDLSFSGHSHGGQVRLPLLGPIITHTMLGKEFASGVISYKGAVCAVSRGMGSSRYLKIRLLCRPQALLIDLSGDEGSKR